MRSQLLLILSFILNIFMFVISAYADTHDHINVFVSIPPQKFLVEQIGGDKVSVNIMVKPGSNPETYEPTPKQMAALNESQLYFQIGVPFESVWIDRIRQTNRQLKVISCCKNLVTTEESSHELDAHVWTSPENVKKFASVIKDTLINQQPDNKLFYERKYSLLTDRLNELDIYIRNKLSNLNNRFLIVSHPSWGYFAYTYNLKQISIEQHGSEIRAKELSRLIEFAKSENIKSVYIQKQVNNASARILANEINARLIELDPLAENYIENMQQVANSIAKGAE